ncbi:phosphoadenosine phosphosulfate reductase family protein [Chamaesiphon sp.]|uniref:phosphoadenosine phosphosulfate reductase domain-containing protein n=1 Tax=Chamaesiphon sp. TaxID=2814140 RepID=UPI003594245B
MKQLTLFKDLGVELVPPLEIQLPNPSDVFKYIICLSGGKDSIACLLWAIEELGVDRLEIWHHEIDGTGANFADWKVTKPYCKAIAEHFGIPIYFSWLGGGFEGELLRDNVPHRETWYETPDGLMSSGGNGKPNVRRRFPSKSADLRVRWCSSSLKIDVCRAAIANQERFKDKTIVVVTGERRQESQNRAKYAFAGEYMAPTKRGRRVYQIRPVLDWTIEMVWEKIAQYKIRPHPAYQWGTGRLSCRTCIFASPAQWATIRRDYPATFDRISSLERELNHTIDAKYSVEQLADRGVPYPHQPDIAALADSETWDLPIIDPNWQLPLGAFGEQNGAS